MKLIKLAGMVAMGVIAWHFFRNGKGKRTDSQPGALSRLVDGIKEEAKKPLNRIDDDIVSPNQ